ncbi:hypothetical protein, partial [Priestia megaterium]|uniref:hypothetical protein n=1 Tax=Priestia megaterium TaxID=1404 RepID=UPI001B3A48C2
FKLSFFPFHFLVAYFSFEYDQHIEKTKYVSSFQHSYQSNLKLFPSRLSMSYSLLLIHEPADLLNPALLVTHNSLYNQDSSLLSSHSLHLPGQALFLFSHVFASQSLNHC